MPRPPVSLASRARALALSALATAACGPGSVSTRLDSGVTADSSLFETSIADDTRDPSEGDARGDGAVVTERFSFFVTSMRALVELSGSANGFGGDLRYGETGPGAGLRGADKICTAIAERSMPGAGRKVWRAFLSATNDGAGTPVHAIDRIGSGPWYDRLGRLVANSTRELLATRPSGADPSIRDDLPNEDGVPNHQPDPTQSEVDNHDTLTGSNDQGRLYSASATCLD